MIAGAFIYLQRPLLLLLVVLLIPMQVKRARKEAQVLEEKFGDAYRNYKSKTWF